MIVQEALDHALEGRTPIVISHIVSQRSKMLTSSLLQGGKVVKMDNHFELIAMKGAYYLLTDAQMSKFQSYGL